MITFFYVVGGQQVHYDNLMRSIRSLRKFDALSKIMVLEIGNKLGSTQDYTVINQPNNIDLGHKGKIGFKFWKQKYIAAQLIDTEFGVYLDSDTVVVNYNFVECLQKIGEEFGVCQHFWVPTFDKFFRESVPSHNKDIFLSVIQKIGISLDTPFFAGGVFLFRNIKENKNIISETLNIYDDVYSMDSSYIAGLTDEIFFSGMLNKYQKYKKLSGALNHCCMGDRLMPIRYEAGILYGRNPFESDWDKITLFHCDPTRRDPSKEYNGIIKEEIQKAWNV